MAFIASQVNLQSGLTQLLQVAQQEKTYMSNWAAQLAGNITALDALAMAANLNRVLPMMDSYAALPGMAPYAQAQFGSTTYDIATEYTSMRAALQAVLDWLTTNIPANAITVTNGTQVGAIYAPAVTAPLLSLVNAAAATIA